MLPFPCSTRRGIDVLNQYYAAYAEIARRSQAGQVLESGTWRASPDWGQRLGHGVSDLARVNARAIAMLIGLRETYAPSIADIVVSGTIGPRGDGYRPDSQVDPADAAAYHRPQLARDRRATVQRLRPIACRARRFRSFGRGRPRLVRR